MTPRKALAMRIKRLALLSNERGLPISGSLPLKLDYDSRRVPPLGELVKRASRANRTIVAVRQWRSPSGRGWHMLMWVLPEPQSAVEVVALQLLMGSDPYREAYNLNRARAVDAGLVSSFWKGRWNVLYGVAGQ